MAPGPARDRFWNLMHEAEVEGEQHRTDARNDRQRDSRAEKRRQAIELGSMLAR
jgi:hypothetical protein